MSKFIKLTRIYFDGYGGAKPEAYAVNVDHIMWLSPPFEKYKTTITPITFAREDEVLEVRETPEQILALINEASKL